MKRNKLPTVVSANSDKEIHCDGNLIGHFTEQKHDEIGAEVCSIKAKITLPDGTEKEFDNELGEKEVGGVSLYGYAGIQRFLRQIKKAIDKQLITDKNDDEVGMKMPQGWTFMHDFVVNNGYRAVDILTELGDNINLNAKNKEGLALAHILAKKGRQHDLSLLCRCGADINIRNNDGETPLHYAVSEYSAAKCHLLINEINELFADFNATDNNGETPLHIAVRHNNAEAVAELIDYEANINVYANDGWTPLHLAAFYCNVEIIKLLVNTTLYDNFQFCGEGGLRPADLDAENDDGETPFRVLEVYHGEDHPAFFDTAKELLKF